MTPYSDQSGESGIVAFEAGKGFIRLRFKEGGIYLYTDERPGRMHVAQMKRLAEAGKGLCTYVNQHVRENYAAKEK